MQSDVEDLRKRNVLIKSVFSFSLPVIIFLLLAATLILTLTIEQAVIILGVLAAYIASPAGKETLIPLLILLGFPWWIIVGCLLVTDICCALMIGWNFWIVLKVPWIGPRLRRWTFATGTYQERHPRLANLSGIGLYFFTMIPFQGFGTITGTIIGTMLGLNKYKVFATVVAGGFTTSFIIAFGLSRLMLLYESYPMQVIIIAAVLAFVTIIAYIHLKRATCEKSGGGRRDESGE